MSDGHGYFPPFEEMSEERQRAHLLDAHGLRLVNEMLADMLVATHHYDHARQPRPSYLIPHAHCKPPTVAEQAKAALRGAFAARAVMEEVVNELDRLGFLRAPHKGDGDA